MLPLFITSKFSETCKRINFLIVIMFIVIMMIIVTSPIFWIQTGYLHLEILVKKIPMEGNSHNTWPITPLENKKANVLISNGSSLWLIGALYWFSYCYFTIMISDFYLNNMLDSFLILKGEIIFFAWITKIISRHNQPSEVYRWEQNFFLTDLYLCLTAESASWPVFLCLLIFCLAFHQKMLWVD